MRFAFSSNAFRSHSLLESAAAIAAAGFPGIEIMADRPHALPADLTAADIRRIGRRLSELGLAAANINGFMLCAIRDFHHPSWIEPDPEFRRLRIEHTIGCLELAAGLGIDTVSTEPGGPLPQGMERETALALFAEGLDLVLPRAAELGLFLLLEPEPGLLLETSAEYLDFITRYGRPELGLNFDVGHFFCVGEDPAKQVAALGSHIRHVHLEDIPADRTHRHLLPGTGAIDIPAVLEAISAIDYQGFVTVELYPYQEDPASTAKQAAHYLRRLGYG